jgi:DNA-directed RNA polymerase specialized sigma24 family protein
MEVREGIRRRGADIIAEGDAEVQKMDESNSMSQGSVSRLLGGLRDGDEESVQQLWQRYAQPLGRLAAARLKAGGGLAADAEDVALDAFFNLCEQLARPASAERFPDLQNRTHLWKLLACFTVREAFDLATKENRRRAIVEDESVLGVDGFAAFAGREPPPEFTAAVADLLEYLPSDQLRAVAIGKMEGRTNPEIARRLGCAVSTIERKLQVIRLLWQDAEGDRT